MVVEYEEEELLVPETSIFTVSMEEARETLVTLYLLGETEMLLFDMEEYQLFPSSASSLTVRIFPLRS